MAVTNGYVTQAALKSAVGLAAGDTADDDELDLAINAASRAIDEVTGQRFWVDGSDVARYYTADSATRLVLHGPPEATTLVTVTSVAVDTGGAGTFGTSLTNNTHYTLGPRSAAVSGGRPYRELVSLPRESWRFPVGVRDGVRITGTFGWSTVPDAIEEACLIQAARLFKRSREAPFGIAPIAGFDVGMRITRLDPDVDALVRPFVIRRF